MMEIEIVEEMIRNRYPSEGYKGVSLETGLSKSEIEAVARRLKVSQKEYKNRLESGLASAISTRYSTEGPAKIAEEFRIAESTVMKRAHKMGLSIDKSVRYKKMSHTMTERHDTNSWRIWNPLTPVGAYYLGFIWADGSVNTETPEEAKNRDSHYNVVIPQSGEENWYILYYLAELLGLSEERVRLVDLKRYKDTYENKKELKLSGKRIVALMTEEFGIFPRKSYSNPIFPNIPNEFLWDFARGVYDGDGSTADYTVTPTFRFYGSYHFMDELTTRLVNSSGIIQYSLRVQEKDSIKKFSVGHPEEVSKIATLLYKERTPSKDYPFLSRKAQPFFDLLDGRFVRGRDYHELKPGYETFRNGTREVLVYDSPEV